MDSIRKNFDEALAVLEKFISDNANLKAVHEAGTMMVNAVNNGKKIIACGNGGSMSDAMHFCEELTGRFKGHRKSISAIAVSDPSYLTCVANDYGYDKVFSRFIEGLGNEGDVLLAISTSGNSANVINAVNASHNKKMKVVGLTGKDGGKMSKLVDVEVRAPYSTYSDRVQEIHIKVIHTLIDFIEKNMAE